MTLRTQSSIYSSIHTSHYALLFGVPPDTGFPKNHSTSFHFQILAQDVMPQLLNIAVIFVVTFVVFPGVAASWAPQLEFFTSKGPLELKKAVGKCKLEV